MGSEDIVPVDWVIGKENRLIGYRLPIFGNFPCLTMRPLAYSRCRLIPKVGYDLIDERNLFGS